MFGEVLDGFVDGGAGDFWDVLRGEDDLVQALDRGQLLDAGDSVFPVSPPRAKRSMYLSGMRNSSET